MKGTCGNFGGAFENVERVKPNATQFEMIRERLGGDVGVCGIGVPELADQCAFDDVNYEGATAVFGGFVQLEIMPNKFVHDIGIGVENRSDIGGGDWENGEPCGRDKHLVLLPFVVSVEG